MGSDPDEKTKPEVFGIRNRYDGFEEMFRFFEFLIFGHAHRWKVRIMAVDGRASYYLECGLCGIVKHRYPTARTERLR